MHEETESLLFSAKDYDAAISRVISADHIVVYCGAGVSQALTGLSWSGLIKAMVRNLKLSLVSAGDGLPNKLLTKGQYEALVEYIQSPNSSPQRNASIVDEFISALSRLPAGKNHDTFLRDIEAYSQAAFRPANPVARGHSRMVVNRSHYAIRSL